jgi:phage repressor protein C with HTH and peptisase S24 domain
MKINGLDFKKAYKQRGFTQKKISEILDINQPQLSDWIKRDSIPDVYIEVIKDKLNIDLINQPNETIESIPTSKDSVPYYDVDVTAGQVDLFQDASSEYASSFITVPGLVADFVVPVHGHSMHPIVSSGDLIAVRRLQDIEWINFGHKYLVITKEQRMVKIIKRHENVDQLVLVSCNDEFDDIDIPRKKIEQLFLIVEVFKREVM